MNVIGFHGSTQNRCRGLFKLGLVLAIASVPAGVLAEPSPDEARAAAVHNLNQRYPDVRVANEGAGRVAVFGQPMSVGDSPSDAARAFLGDFSSVLGFAADDAHLQSQNTLGSERFSVFRYRQFMDGLPVEDALINLLVLRGTPDRVVYAGGHVAKRPNGGFAGKTIDPALAVETTRRLPAYAQLPSWSEPELVVFFQDRPAPVRCWKFLGMQPALNLFEAYTFFVDATAGEMVHVRNEVYNIDITGQVEGQATPGTAPDRGSNPPEWTALDNIRVRVQGGGTAFSNGDGDFTIPHFGSSPVTVEGDLIGDWAKIFNAQGGELHIEESVTPPGPVSLFFNPTPAEWLTSQINGFLHTTLTHDFFKDRQPDYDGLDLRIPCNVNITDSPLFPCNAFFSGAGGPSINFFSTGGGCVNSAYSSIIAHEYGHFVVSQLGLPQGAFGEGFGDSVGVLLYDDPITGRDFAGPGAHIRNLANPNIQYPCFGGIHQCGRVLGGVWWDIRTEMGATYGEAEGLERTRQLFTDWSLITSGGSGSDSAHELTAIEVLAVDDVDGDPANGTPNFFEICAGFADHNIPCPLDCNTNGVPDFVDIDNGTSDDTDDNGVPDECHTIRAVPDEFATIQSAITAAEEGDTILVGPGVYRESLFINTTDKIILLKGAAGPDHTIIDGGNAGSAVVFQNFQQFPPNNGQPQSRLDGFTITNGNAASGGGIHGINSNPRITNCRIVGNTSGAGGGGGIHFDEGYPLIQDCTITNNRSGGLGGGLRFDDAVATVRNCLFAENEGGGDGGAVFGLGGSVSLQNCTTVANTGQSAVAFYNGEHSIQDSILWDDLPPQNTELTLHSATVTVDYSDVQGGAENVAVSNGVLSWQTHNLSVDPLFAPGPLGCYYLSEAGVGEAPNSPCVDAGSDTAASLGLDAMTTSGDEGADQANADLGFHHAITGLPLTMGDFDRNGAVDLFDFGNLQACFTGPATDTTPCCRIFDFEHDADIDLDDYADFTTAVTGPE